MIPNKDEKETLKKCLESIWQKTTYSNYEIILVENNSTTREIRDYYQELDGKNGVRVVYWDKEFNYSAINNFGISYAKGEYILCLNNDITVISPEWMEELLANCQRPEVGIVGARLYLSGQHDPARGHRPWHGRLCGQSFRRPGEKPGRLPS